MQCPKSINVMSLKKQKCQNAEFLTTFSQNVIGLMQGVKLKVGLRK